MISEYFLDQGGLRISLNFIAKLSAWTSPPHDSPWHRNAVFCSCPHCKMSHREPGEGHSSNQAGKNKRSRMCALPTVSILSIQYRLPPEKKLGSLSSLYPAHPGCGMQGCKGKKFLRKVAGRARDGGRSQPGRHRAQGGAQPGEHRLRAHSAAAGVKNTERASLNEAFRD